MKRAGRPDDGAGLYLRHHRMRGRWLIKSQEFRPRFSKLGARAVVFDMPQHATPTGRIRLSF